jgi:hypothetical protein
MPLYLALLFLHQKEVPVRQHSSTAIGQDKPFAATGAMLEIARNRYCFSLYLYSLDFS